MKFDGGAWARQDFYSMVKCGSLIMNFLNDLELLERGSLGANSTQFGLFLNILKFIKYADH